MARRRSFGRQRAGSVRRRLVPYRRPLRFEPLEDRRLLAVVTVGNVLDLVNGDTSSIINLIANDGGDGISLREAILAANNTLGADEITFDVALSGQTITLGGTELAIGEALRIDARPLAANVTIDAQQLSRIFNITTTTGDFMLGGLTLTGGRTTADLQHGGAVRSLTTGELTLDQSTVSGNSTAGSFSSGGGIRAAGALTLTRSTVSGNSTTGTNNASGGGISASGAVTLTQSTVSGNSTAGSAAHGGGISAGGSVTLTESTVSGNSAAGNNVRGGGIYALGTVALTQSTVSGNSTTGSSAHGGGINARGAVTLTQSTVTDNHALHATAMGGGVYQFNSASNHPFSISGSILAGNTAGGGGADLVKDPQSVLTVNYSLIGVADGLTFAGDVGNLTGTAASPLDPQLGSLANNGGPSMTHALLAGSPAIDAGDPSITFDPDEFDQRGAPFVRVFGGRIDIGAYERQMLAQAMFVVTTADDELDYTNGAVSLREAINSANGSVGANTITFAAALSGQTIALGGTELVVGVALVIDARPLAANVTIDAQQLSRIFHITATTGDFMLGGLTLTGGRTTGNNAISITTFSGGAIRSLTTGDLTLEQSTVSGNSTAGIRAEGGGIFANGAVTLTQSTVSGNSTAGDYANGGGIRAGGAVTLTHSTVSGNSTAGDFSSGGGIRSESGALTLTQSTVSGNSTTGSSASGGGIRASGPVTLTQSTVSGNSTAGGFANGGGIRTIGTVTLTQSTVSGNSTTGNGANGGGIILAGSGNLTLDQSTVSGNSTAGNSALGGGVWANGAVTLTQSTVSGNSTAGGFANGGGIRTSGAVTLTQSTVTDNHALHATAMGGGVYQYNTTSNHPFSISGSILAGNTAGGGGADLVKDPQSSLTVNYSLIGTGFLPTAGGNNVFANNPQLGPLANNGGPTMTHAPLPGSPAIDAGDPGITFDPDEFDQRGAPFVRVFDGRIDIGAYERQTVADLNLVVDSAGDENDGDYSPGNLSLREAIGLANGSVADDEITFDVALSGQTITLGGTELAIGEALRIDARPLAANVTIDAQQLSRIFNITTTTGDFMLGGLTLTGGRTTADGLAGLGGAIRSLASGNLTLDQSTVSGNSTAGNSALGGGVFANGAVTLTQSTVSGNSTTGPYASGGAVFAFGSVTLTQSTVSGNSTTGNGAHGGGIILNGSVTLTQSTVSGNSTTGSSASGGGIRASGAVTLTQSTVTDNHALHATSQGGGVFQVNTASNHPFSNSGSIVAGNTAGGGGDDLVKDPQSTLTVNYSLIGTGITPDSGGNNVVTGDPQLGSLANNGGPTWTHALLPGSPAIDAGDPSAVADVGDVPEFDQRGAPFTRVYGGRIDIGAVESQPMPSAFFGDYNQDGTVNAADYVLWRKTLGTTGVPAFSGADGDGDGDITQADYDVWRANYGNTLPPPAPGSGAAATAAIDEAIALDEQATTHEHTAQNTTAFDEALVSVGSDVALQFDSAATSSSRVAKFRLPIMERLIRFHAAQKDLLLAVSPADRARRHEPTGPLHKAAERDLAADHDAALLGASDAWFAALGSSPF